MNYDDDFDPIFSVDLEHPDKGFTLCPDCEGQGTRMFHRCYPNGPEECWKCCDTCDGEGQLPIPAKASISRNKREGQYFGKYRTRHRRMGTVNFDRRNYLPYEVTEADFKATRSEQRQHKKNRSFIRRQGARP